jgi:hypothetical protein
VLFAGDSVLSAEGSALCAEGGVLFAGGSVRLAGGRVPYADEGTPVIGCTILFERESARFRSDSVPARPGNVLGELVSVL